MADRILPETLNCYLSLIFTYNSFEFCKFTRKILKFGIINSKNERSEWFKKDWKNMSFFSVSSMLLVVLGLKLQQKKHTVVVIGQEDLDKLEELWRIKIDFMLFSIKKRAANRSTVCFNCGEANHKFVKYKSSPSILCKEKFGDKQILVTSQSLSISPEDAK